ncbi:receptor-like protein 35 [Salvia divinorum]|uniref:Receptor-like protein 35 n=1 Tax=Salvia divinorum TaxID=28513 RepID=A0ABD1GE91_SALDI
MLSSLLFFICILTSSCTFTTHSYNNKCLRHQEILLLKLKHELIFDSSRSTKLVRWNGSVECCLWHGVECDASGYVVSLHLDGEAISGGVRDSSSLFRFKYLQKLNLAYNYFDYTHHIPKGIGNLTYLTHLNLSNAGFVGQVPAEISSLTRLVSLDISKDIYFGSTLSLEHPNLEMLVQNLTELRELHLDEVYISSLHESENWVHIISSHLPNLTSLSLADCNLFGPLPKSFSKLHSLSILRLDRNNLSTVALHDLLTNFPSLTALTLSGCSLKGSIPSTFANLTKLSHVDLSVNSLTGPLPSTLFANLTKLSHVDLSFNSLTGSLPSTLFANLTKLSHVDLSFNSLTGSLPSTLFANLTKLSHVDFSENSLTGSLPSTLFANLTKLSHVDLSVNSLTGPLPSTLFANLTKLSHVDLSFNSLTGSLPSTLFANLTKLSHVDLSDNSLTGSLPSTFFEGLSNLVHLDLSVNSFSGNIPRSLFALPSLLELDLSDNQFNGTFQLDHFRSLPNLTLLDPSGNSLSIDAGNVNSSSYGGLQLKGFEFIKHLDLSNNSIAGEIPSWIWGTQLEYLDLSFNLLTNLQKPYYIPPTLYTIYLQSNQLRDELHLPVSFESELYSLNLADNKLSGSIPTFICNATQLIDLDLSGNKLSGSIPTCLGNATQLETLDLSGNKLSGSIPTCLCNATQLSHLDLYGNKLSGSIPTCLCNATLIDLDLSGNKLSGSIPACLLINIRVIDLSGNNISGGIPPFPLQMIGFLDLSQNYISGSIPDIFPTDCGLTYLYLNNNTLEGKIPKSLGRCTQLKYMNVGNNMMNDTFPCMLSPTLRVLVLHSNRFHGQVRCHISWLNLQILDISSNHFSGSLESINFSSWMAMELPSDGKLRDGNYDDMYSSGLTLIVKGQMMELYKIWADFSTIDLSSNSFYGKIPNAIGNLTSLHQLNFSHNSLNGSIPKSFGQLKNLESLDLSVNQLAGQIPEELGGLTFLSKLNLSYNKFVGVIPKGRQIQTFSADSYEGNSGLCGFPLDTSCSNTSVPPPPGYDENGEEKREIEWEYVCAAVGYVVGVGSIVWLLLFCRSFREKYFGKIEEVVEGMFVARDMRRRRARRAAARNRVSR